MKNVICPFMSTAEKQVECLENCALRGNSCPCILAEKPTENEFLFQKDLLLLLTDIKEKLNNF